MLRMTAPAGTRIGDSRSFNVYVAGSESNVLSHLAQLGGRTCWLSALPDSPIGNLIVSEVRRYGVDTRVATPPGESRAGTFYAEVLPEPAGPTVIYDRSHSAFAATSSELYDLSPVEDSCALLLTGITPALGDNPRELVIAALDAAAKAKVPLIFDVNYRAKLWSPESAAEAMALLIKQAAVVICPLADAGTLWGIEGTAPDVAKRFAERLELAPGTRLVITLGAEGAIEWIDGTLFHADSYPTNGTGRFGAGDAFTAGYLAGWLELQSFISCRERYGVTRLQFGCAVAALKRCTNGDMATLRSRDLDNVFNPARFR